MDILCEQKKSDFFNLELRRTVWHILKKNLMEKSFE